MPSVYNLYYRPSVDQESVILEVLNSLKYKIYTYSMKNLPGSFYRTLTGHPWPYAGDWPVGHASTCRYIVGLHGILWGYTVYCGVTRHIVVLHGVYCSREVCSFWMWAHRQYASFKGDKSVRIGFYGMFVKFVHSTWQNWIISYKNIHNIQNTWQRS